MNSYEIIAGNYAERRVRLSIAIFETLTKIRAPSRESISTSLTSDWLLFNENLPPTNSFINARILSFSLFLFPLDGNNTR